MSSLRSDKCSATSGASRGDWRPITDEIKDGRLVKLTWMHDGEPQDTAQMRWSAIARNLLFPKEVGFWVTPCGTFTWNPHDGFGPTHWRPCDEPNWLKSQMEESDG